MPAEQALRDGNLLDALEEVQDQVRRNPAEAKHRIFLFQLFVLSGDWVRAKTQLDVLNDLDASAVAMVSMYRDALRCEAMRSDVFAGERSPLIFGEPEPWMALVLEALKLSADGHFAQAQEPRGKAYEDAPATPGHLQVDGDPQVEVPFEWIADADSRIGPMIEAIVNGRYFWIPVHRIARLTIEAPEDLRDLVWAPAQVMWANEGEAVALLPVRYPGSEAADNDGVRLARRTEWEECAADEFHGLGQRVFATDAGEHDLLRVRQIELTVPDDDAVE